MIFQLAQVRRRAKNPDFVDLRSLTKWVGGTSRSFCSQSYDKE